MATLLREMHVSEGGRMGMVQCHILRFHIPPSLSAIHVSLRSDRAWAILNLVSTLMLPCFLATFYSMGGKIDKITKIFDKVEDIKNRGVIYQAEKNGPMVIQIISC
jgi:hypothetical protein